MTAAVVIALALGVVALAAVIALALVARQLRRTRAELARLRASIRPAVRRGPVAATERVLKAVAQGAARLRDEGVGGMLASSLEDFTQWASEDRSEIVRVAAHDGTVTFFFSDIEDSTGRNERLGDEAWLRLLDAHNRLVRGAIERHRGHVVKTIGDGFMAVFGDPGAAVRAALRIHEGLRSPTGHQLRRHPVRVRIGVHAGTAVARDGDYFGRNVALCARIAARAVGGQTLVSASAEQAVRDEPGLRLVPLGEVTLKGIAEDIELWSVEALG